MSTAPMPSRAPLLSAARLRGDFFPWVLALATGLDYYDNAIFSFFTSYIAGGINASPDELVWSSSAYAVGAVLGILQQQWWVERVGYRRYVAGSLLFYSAGAMAAALCESSIELAFARGFQGYCIGPMMGTCRILIQICFTPQQRPVATRAFLILIVLSSALAPLAGGLLVSHFDWRALFAFSAPAGVIYAVLALLALPDSGHVLPEERGGTHFWPYIIFAFAQGALQIAMQQVRFELFSNSPGILFLTVAGMAALAWFAWHQWHHPKPLMRLHALREKPFRVGLLLYMLYYYLTTALSYQVSRLLEGGLNYPVENAGRLTGVTSLISATALFVYFRYSKYIAHKKWIIVPGFVLAAFIAFWMTRLTPDTSQSWLVFPLLLRGLLLLFIVLPVANLTFRIFAIEEFTHGYRLKNVVRQLTMSFATATVIILEQHRLALHQTRLVEFVNPLNPIFQNTYATLVHAFEGLGRSPSEAQGLAIAQMSRMVAQQASFLSSLDGFYFLIGVAIVGGVFAAWQKQID
ncbi:MFS family permease [Paraburkholderia bannensis]|uniref:MFS family permease n=2 Tax=Burkholderiaceae TaxID=119060 RepID=A0A7W9WVC7_9BURK|nr:MFS family permease [Paraburkholderia sp. WP4_3_2]MBB6104728.1 MFS family permease [Paraburkholderia bannensis]